MSLHLFLICPCQEMSCGHLLVLFQTQEAIAAAWPQCSAASGACKFGARMEGERYFETSYHLCRSNKYYKYYKLLDLLVTSNIRNTYIYICKRLLLQVRQSSIIAMFLYERSAIVPVVHLESIPPGEHWLNGSDQSLPALSLYIPHGI